LIQIEIVYRCAVLVFPGKRDLQAIARVFGAMVPMHTYICQVVGNEPLAGALMSLVGFGCLRLIVPGHAPPGPRFFGMLGLAWGLALLTKVTAVLLAPVLVIVIAVAAASAPQPLRKGLRDAALVLGVAALTSGWYFVRNCLELGRPFVGGWDPSRRIEWWQDPGYRTWSQLLSFGRSLVRPVYSGVASFWDSLYSTLWLDGFHSGVVSAEFPPPWNANFVSVSAILGLLPTFLILAGSVRVACRKRFDARAAALLSVVTLALFVAAIFDLYVRLPIYSTAKVTYTLGLLPCYAILMASGAEPLLESPRAGPVVKAGIACWACAAYVAYFVLSGT